MIDTYDVKAKNRPSDVILDSINRLHDAKLSGALKEDELSSIIINIGDMFANKIKQGKVSNDDIESFEVHISGFTGENKDNYFAHSHADLDRSTKIVFESIDFAKDELDQRKQYSQPVMDAESYTKSFKKLG